MNSISSQDSHYMQLAIQLAYKGAGYVSPNPMVGCVIVKDDQVIGQGYHMQYGGPHAEVNAFRSVGGDATHATWYVTLEPCAHTGKTPPCIDLILQHQPERVVIGIQDPNPQVDGGSIAKLKALNIPVTVGVGAQECTELTRFFLTNQTKHRPHVILKYTESQDGFITDTPGKPTKLSSEAMDIKAHTLRGQVDGILIGASTLRTDNPSLTTRYHQGRTAKRIILTQSGNIPFDAKVFTDEWKEKTITVKLPLSLKGVGGIFSTEQQKDFLNLISHLQTNHNIHSLLIEGGKKIWHWALKSPNYIDEIWRITCPLQLKQGVRHDIKIPDIFALYTQSNYGIDTLRIYKPE